MKYSLFVLFSVGSWAVAVEGHAQQLPYAQLHHLCEHIAFGLTLGDPSAATHFGQPALQLVSQQTAGTGRYGVLARLGQPIRAEVSPNVVPLLFGAVFTCQVLHANGISSWYFAVIGEIVNQFRFEAHLNPPTPGPPDAPPADHPQPQPQPQPPAAPSTPSKSEACRKFPDLC